MAGTDESCATSVDLPSLRGVGRARRQPQRTGFMQDAGCLRDLPQAALSPTRLCTAPHVSLDLGSPGTRRGMPA